MTYAGLAAARESNRQLAEIIPSVSGDQWELPSACAGWRVIDVLAHLGALAYETVRPPEPDPTWPKIRERYHDMRVNERRGWSHAEVITEWQDYAPKQLAIQEACQEAAVASEPVVVPGLGTYPRHLMANITAFNVFCHLRFDILAPEGPLPFAVSEPTDELVAPAVEFMLAGLPQMQGPELDATVTVPLVLVLTGPGAVTATVLPPEGPAGHLTVLPGSHGLTRIRTTAVDFIAWSTKRKSWRDFCRISGAADAATPFLDCLNII